MQSGSLADYEVMAKLGEGSFSTVYKGSDLKSDPEVGPTVLRYEENQDWPAQRKRKTECG